MQIKTFDCDKQRKKTEGEREREREVKKENLENLEKKVAVLSSNIPKEIVD